MSNCGILKEMYISSTLALRTSIKISFSLSNVGRFLSQELRDGFKCFLSLPNLAKLANIQMEAQLKALMFSFANNVRLKITFGKVSGNSHIPPTLTPASKISCLT